MIGRGRPNVVKRCDDADVRFLIVEDEPKVARFIQTALTEGGVEVDIALNATVGLQQFRSATYHLVVLDVMLPDTDGFETCRQIRAMGLQVPVLMLSARNLVEDRVRGLNSGADDYLTKPFDVEELRARVRALLRRYHEPALSALTVADLTLDPATRVVTRGVRRIDLTQKEFALLDFLMRNAGQAVTRTMIAERVWDFPWDRLTNVIDVFISHLRKKIELPGEPPLVHAVRGVGYVIRDPSAAN